MTNFKVVNNADAGTATKHGGNDVDRYSQVFNGIADVAPFLDLNTQFRIRSGRLELRNTANSFSYSIVGAALAANHTLNLPLLTATDTVAVLSTPQTFTGKTIDATLNTLTNIAKGSIPSTVAYEDELNTFTSSQKFETYSDLKAIAAPASPAASYGRTYFDSADGKYKIKKSDGTVIDLEATAGGGGTDEKVIVREAGVAVGASARKLNFPVASDFDLAEDTVNDAINVGIADNAIGDSEIAAHSSTKISILDKSLLNPLIHYKDETDSIMDTMMAPHTTTKITTTNKALLNTSIVYEDEDNNLGDHFLDFGDIAVPANPAAGIRRVFFDTATGKLSIRTSAGNTVSLEEQGGGGSGGLQAGGTAQKNGTGAQTVFTIAHGLGVIPDAVFADAASTDAQGEFVRTKDATNITLTYALAPPLGTNNVKFEWGASAVGAAAPTFTPTTSNTLSNKIYQDALFSTYQDYMEQATAPANPAADNARVYMKDIDANNQGLFAKIKKAGAFVEVQIF